MTIPWGCFKKRGDWHEEKKRKYGFQCNKQSIFVTGSACVLNTILSRYYHLLYTGEIYKSR